MATDDDLELLEKKLASLLESRENIQSLKAKSRADTLSSRMFVYMADYAQWCYENRVMSLISKFLLYSIFIFVLLLSAWGISGTGVGSALGMDSVRDRITNMYFAVLWSSRSAAGAELMPISPTRYSGTVEKVVGDVMVISYYDNGQKLRRLAQFANVIVTDKKGFSSWAKDYHLKGLLIDFYEPLGTISDKDVWGVVLWSQRKPINVELVESGIGYPEKNPPTAVVNQIFSQYYWHKARAGN